MREETEHATHGAFDMLVEALAGAAGPVELDCLIATLPDPKLTRLDWTFDSQLDALRPAFESDGFVLERFSMPVRSGTPESQPGTLMFVRRTAPEDQPSGKRVRIAFVYLVGELPTRGIDLPAFLAALDERCQLRLAPSNPQACLVDAATLRIIGPTFSGSSPSLRAAIEAGSSFLQGTSCIRVVSGSATSASNRAKISDCANLGSTCVTFETTLHTDAALMQVLTDELLPRLDLDPSQVAILSESSTSYGQGLERGEMLQIPFPMSIHTLRREYDENGQLIRQDFAPPGRSAATRIPLDLSDERAEELQTTSELTPASIDLLLEEMTRILEQRRIRAVLLFATDVRDKLFLGCELKNRLPDLQLFTTEGNVLYVRPELNRWLRGMVVLSTYPIMLGAGHAPSPSNEELLFANEGAAGIYNATLVQLDRDDLVRDYAHRSNGGEVEHRPPVLVSVVGAGTMLPVRSFPSDAVDWAPMSLPLSREASSMPAEPVRLGVVAIFLFSCGLAMRLHKARRRERWVVRLLRRGRDPGATIERRHEASLALQYELYRLCRHAALWSILLPNTTLLLGLSLSRGQQAFTYLVTVVALTASLRGVYLLFLRARRCLRDWKKFGTSRIDFFPELLNPIQKQRRLWIFERGMRSLLTTLAGLFLVSNLALCARILWFLFDEDDSSFGPLLRRSVEVDQGLSFLLPTILTGMILVLWCGWHCQRLKGLAAAPPVEGPLDQGLVDERQLASQLRRRLFRVVPAYKLVPYTVVALLILGWLTLRVERPIDDLFLGWKCWLIGSPFDLILRFGIVCALAASAWAVVRLATIWQALASLLEAIRGKGDLLPDEALRGRIGKTIDLSLLPTATNSDLQVFRDESWSRLLAREQPESSRIKAVQALPRVACFARVHEEPDSVARDAQARALNLLGSDPEHEGERERELVRDVLIAEVLLYVDWALEHCRRLAWFLVGAILLTTALVWSYPVQPQSILQLASFAVFSGSSMALLWFAAAANRNPTLSRIAGTKPGSLTWDRSLIVNLLFFVLVPFASLLTSQAPELRQVVIDSLRSFLGGFTAG